MARTDVMLKDGVPYLGLGKVASFIVADRKKTLRRYGVDGPLTDNSYVVRIDSSDPVASDPEREAAIQKAYDLARASGEELAQQTGYKFIDKTARGRARASQLELETSDSKE